ncbi:MAG: hypothetical protein ABII02_02900 [Candidatus Magasanikbacteria bacterium]
MSTLKPQVRSFFYSLCAVFMFVGSFLVSIPQAHAESKEFVGSFSPITTVPFMDTNGSGVIWFDAGANTIKYKNVTLGTTAEIKDITQFKGLSLLWDGIYWVDGSVLYEYKISTKVKKQMLDLSTIEDIEKDAKEFWLRTMVSPLFFEYSVRDNSGTTHRKQYDFNTQQAFGVTGRSGSTLFGDSNEFFKKSGDAASDSFYELAYLGQHIVLIGHPTQFGDSYDELRTKIVPLGIPTTVKSGIQFTGMFRDGKSEKDRAVFWRSTGLYVLNTNTGNETKQIEDFSQSTNITWTGSDALWSVKKADSNYYYWYNATMDATCYLDQDDSILSSNPNYSLTNGFLFWSTNEGKVYSKRLVCTDEPVGSTTSPTPTITASSGDLIKMVGNPSVYYLGADGKRYVFYNENIFLSWYTSFSGVKELSKKQMEDILIGGNVTYRPGKLIKITTDPKVYAVDKGGALRWIKTEEVAAALFGKSWAGQIIDVPDFLFVNYKIGNSVNAASDFSPYNAKINNSTINIDKSL